METTILLVDDEQAFVVTTSKRLSLRGLNVLTAHGGQEALDILADHKHVSVVILDVKMPDMDGIETLKRIKAKHPLVEVIMLTGHGSIDNAIEGMKLGAFDYLTKPCDWDDMLAKIHAAHGKKANHEEKILSASMQEISRRRGY